VAELDRSRPRRPVLIGCTSGSCLLTGRLLDSGITCPPQLAVAPAPAAGPLAVAQHGGGFRAARARRGRPPRR
jgi:hypothetical protein